MRRIFKLFLSLLLAVGIILTQQSVFANKVQPFQYWHSLFMIVYMPKDNEYSPLMQRAIGEWQAKLGKSVDFYFTDDAGDKLVATITVSFNSVTGENAKNSVTATCNKTPVLIKDAKIVVNAKNNSMSAEGSTTKDENDKELYSMMVHAVGVALGVPVSADENSIMYPERKGNQVITDADVQILKKLFVTPAQGERNTK